jgi:hypothetical protein
MNIWKLKGPEKMLQMTGKCKLQEHKSRVLLYYFRLILYAPLYVLVLHTDHLQVE